MHYSLKNVIVRNIAVQRLTDGPVLFYSKVIIEKLYISICSSMLLLLLFFIHRMLRLIEDHKICTRSLRRCIVYFISLFLSVHTNSFLHKICPGSPSIVSSFVHDYEPHS